MYMNILRENSYMFSTLYTIDNIYLSTYKIPNYVTAIISCGKAQAHT